MMVSVCIPTYNGESYIEAQLLSILPQLGASDEVIVSDDHSSDGTINKILNLHDARIKVLTNTRNPGLLGNLENALREAKGDIIYLSDQDDLWYPGKVARVTPLMEHYDLVLTDATVIDSEGKVLHPSFFKQNYSGRGFLRNWVNNSFMGCCMTFNRKVLEAALPFPAKIAMHDSWIGMVAILKGRYFLLHEPQVYYRRHPKNTITSLRKDHLPVHIQIWNRVVLMYYLLKNVLIC